MIKSMSIEKRQISVHWDVIAAVLCLFAGLLGVQLITDYSYWAKKVFDETAAPIGQVKQIEGAVRHRTADSYAWLDLNTNSDVRGYPIAEGDMIFTGPTGTAEIQLNPPGATIKLFPNSLIVAKVPQQTDSTKSIVSSLFTSRPVQKSVEIKAGRAQLKIPPRGAPISFTARNKSFRLENRASNEAVSVVIDMKDARDTLKITMLEGTDARLAGDSVATLSPGKPVIIETVETLPQLPETKSTPKSTPIPKAVQVPQVQTPQIKSSVVTWPANNVVVKRNTGFLFTWRKALNADRYWIQVASDPEFSHLLLDQPTPDNFQWFVPKKGGTLYWRVKNLTKTKDGAWSKRRSFVVK